MTGILIPQEARSIHLPLSELRDFPNRHFKARGDKAMQETAESIVKQ